MYSTWVVVVVKHPLVRRVHGTNTRLINCLCPACLLYVFVIVALQPENKQKLKETIGKAIASMGA